MAQPRSRAPLIIGLTAAGGVGYYLYSAGGSPKVAEKKFEGMFYHDCATELQSCVREFSIGGYADVSLQLMSPLLQQRLRARSQDDQRKHRRMQRSGQLRLDLS